MGWMGGVEAWKGRGYDTVLLNYNFKIINCLYILYIYVYTHIHMYMKNFIFACILGLY